MATTFSSDILPLFRSTDINCMNNKGVHLDDAQWMCDAAGNDDFADYANARHVFAALSSAFMPPGHPWPQPSLDTYTNWMSDGFLP